LKVFHILGKGLNVHHLGDIGAATTNVNADPLFCHNSTISYVALATVQPVEI
jgi:hypothetical protein